jgi:uncharacterized membrane protein SpoIIM required for sporulation
MIDHFVTTRRPRWQRLEQLAARSRRGGGRRLSASELEELGALYRQAASDLAIARRDFPRDRSTRYLESLVARVHQAVYQQPTRGWASLWEWLSVGYPRAFREAWRYTLISFLFFIVPFLITLFGTLVEPRLGRVILPPGDFVQQVEEGQTWLDIESADRPLVASSIATNNIQVTFIAFAGGAIFGLGTVFVLVNNGLQIGAVAGLASSYGLGDEIWSFVAGHGWIELTVIFIAGGCGLRIGYALLRPGLLTRRVALSEAANKAMRLMAGCVPLLLIAGLIEGFISPSSLHWSIRLAIGFGAWLLFMIYVLTAGRGQGMGDGGRGMREGREGDRIAVPA